MKRLVMIPFLLLGVATYAQRGGAQTQLEKNTPQIPYDAVSLPLMPTGHTLPLRV